MLETRPDYVPREQVSPSRFKLDAMCARADAWRYVVGVRELSYTWDQIKNDPKPPADFDKKDKAAAKAHRKLVKAWNKRRRPALGKQGHEIIEAWYNSFRVGAPAFDGALWQTEPGRIMLVGLDQLPHPSILHSWQTETKIPDSFVHDITGGAFSYEFNAYIDLLATLRVPTQHGYEIVNDYKTTSSFDWMLKPAELLNDPQGIAYPLYAMHRKRVGPGVVTNIGHGNTERIVARWLYLRTEDTPQARPVDFMVTYEGAKRRALPMFAHGDKLVQRVRDRVDPNDVPANVLRCLDFFHDTCVYHHSVGGPCNPPDVTPGQRLRAVLADPTRREKIEMGFKDNKAKAGGSSAPKSDANKEKAQSGASEGSEGAEQTGGDAEGAVDGGGDGGSEGAVDGGGDGGSEGGTDGGSDSGASAGTTRRVYSRKAKSSASGEGVGVVTVTFESGASFALPESSPLYGKMSNLHAALFGE